MLFNKDSRKWTKKALRPDISYTPIKFSVLWHGRIEILHRKNKALHTYTCALYPPLHEWIHQDLAFWQFQEVLYSSLLWTEYYIPSSSSWNSKAQGDGVRKWGLSSVTWDYSEKGPIKHQQIRNCVFNFLQLLEIAYI